MKVSKILLPLAILAVGVGGFMVLKAGKPEPSPAEVKERVWRVDTINASPKGVAPQILLYGSVEAPQLVKASAPATAVVQSMLVAEGQFVKKGDALFTLDERDFLPQLEQMEARITQERNRHSANEKLLIQEQRLLTIARENEKRAETLLNKNLGSQAALDDARRNTRNQRLSLTQRQLEINNHPARLKDLVAQLSQLKTQFERSRLTAPFDAIVVDVNASQGDMVRTGDVLISFYAPKELEVRARIPSAYESIVLGALASGTHLSAVSDSGHKLTLNRIGAQASSSGISALFRLESDVMSPLIGQQLTLRLSLLTQSKGVVIPASALYGDKQIFLLKEGRMQSVEVERLGQVSVNGQARLLIGSDLLGDDSEIIVTHLPNAVSGLRVQSTKEMVSKEQ